MKTGFTLIELLVVVLIIGILASVALPKYQVAVEKSRVIRSIATCRVLLDAQHRYYLATGTNTADMDELDTEISYTAKIEGATYTGYQTSTGRFHLYPAGHLCVIGGKGWTLDVYQRNSNPPGICYPSQPNGLGERVCKALGPKQEGRISSANTAVYQINY